MYHKCCVVVVRSVKKTLQLIDITNEYREGVASLHLHLCIAYRRGGKDGLLTALMGMNSQNVVVEILNALADYLRWLTALDKTSQVLKIPFFLF